MGLFDKGHYATYEEIRKVTWGASFLDQKQRKAVRQALYGLTGGGGLSKTEYERAIYKLYKEGEISSYDKDKLMSLR